ncbi:transglutaminaseTgpA domain-containing protein [Candidatus Riflebacteria bacterium]
METGLIKSSYYKPDVRSNEPLFFFGFLATFFLEGNFFPMLLFFFLATAERKLSRIFWQPFFYLCFIIIFFALLVGFNLDPSQVNIPLFITSLLWLFVSYKVFHPVLKCSAEDFFLAHVILFFVIASITENPLFILFCILDIYFILRFLLNFFNTTVGGNFLLTTFPVNKVLFSLFSLMLLGFIFLPRYSKTRAVSTYAAKTGFSTNIYLGELKGILKDERIVLRVKSRSKDYLRGMTFDHFNGVSWLNTSRMRRKISNFGGSYLLHSSNQPIWGTKRFQIYVESGEFPVLFQPQYSNHFQSTIFKSLVLKKDRDNNILLPELMPRQYSYFIFANRPMRKIEHIPERKVQDFFDNNRKRLKKYLQLPDNFPVFLKLKVRELTRGTKNTLEKCRQIEKWLKDKFHYSLELTISPEESPLEKFLLEKKGHCELFATTMALMLRSIDIPTRISTGFVLREFNNYSKTYVVRNSHAHAWVQVAFPAIQENQGMRWELFDPTPAAATFDYRQKKGMDEKAGESESSITFFDSESYKAVGHFYDYCKQIFKDNVLNFSFPHQVFKAWTYLEHLLKPYFPELLPQIKRNYFWLAKRRKLIFIVGLVFILLLILVERNRYNIRFRKRELEIIDTGKSEDSNEIIEIIEKFNLGLRYGETFKNWLIRFTGEYKHAPFDIRQLINMLDKYFYGPEKEKKEKNVILQELNQLLGWEKRVLSEKKELL